ncbi:hypothetical protein CLV34_0984 [Luteimicrobium subarcticum]|uniref:Uncharacterized protein n=2 Tax=Luteimicrobium subarcticum TaxID=620910 RepID=A0A2M8WW35_9MICO|nr:hypothetical protein CLV34_0984 [Luteimicrobium subarcticum]
MVESFLEEYKRRQWGSAQTPRADQVPTGGFAPAGAGVTLRGRSQYVELSGLYWNDHLVHRVLVNPRHELALAA